MTTEIILNLLGRELKYKNHQYQFKHFEGEVTVRDADFEIIVHGEYELSYDQESAELTSIDYLSILYKNEVYSTELEDGVNDIIITDDDRLKILEFFNHITLI